MSKLHFRIPNKQTVFAVGDIRISCETGKMILRDDVNEYCRLQKIKIENANKSVHDIVLQYKNDFSAVCEKLKIQVDLKFIEHNLIKYILYEMMYDVDDIEPIKQEEFQWINENLYCAQLRYRDKDAIVNKRTTKTLDVNAMFDYAQIGMNVPISHLQFDTITEIDLRKHQVFFVRIKIIGELPEHIYQTFDNKNDWFSKYDLLILNNYGCEYKLMNCENNYAYYEKTQRIKHKAINILFEMRKTNTVAKKVLKLLHGVACSRPRERTNEITERTELIDDKALKRKYEANLNYHYRLKTVIYCTVKYLMSKHIKTLIDNDVKIYRIATDSITFANSNILDNKIGDKIGLFKIENKFETDGDYRISPNMQFIDIWTESQKKFIEVYNKSLD